MVRRILCFGNRLHGDDGIGPCIAEALHQRNLPEDIAVTNLETDGLALPILLADCQEAVLVDAWRGEGPTGQVVVRTIEEILTREANASVSHGLNLGFALQSTQTELGKLPPIRLVTVTVAEIAMFRIGLSPAVAQATPHAVREITRLLGLGEDG
ncbi:MAG: hydrogenase maturation protease [Gammaproteobacteria bacterium]|nr:hydrogenase maturation protease [Gammaproteobacteria bacterium]